MKSTLLTLILAVASIPIFTESKLASNHAMKLDRNKVVDKLRLGKEPFEAVREMHNMWYVHSLKGLLVQMAKELVPKLNEESERDLLLCLNRIPSKTDIVRASQCLIEARRTLTEKKVPRITTTTMSAFVIADSKEEHRAYMKRRFKKVKKHRKMPKEEHARFKRSEYRLVEKAGEKKQRVSYIRRTARTPDLLNPSLSPVQRFSKALLTVYHGKEETTPAWSHTYKSILKMKKGMDAAWKGEGARVYDLPMDRLVFDRNTSHLHPHSSSFPTHNVKMPEVVERAFSLADTFRAHISHDHKDSNVKMLSPRFAPVLPDKHDGRGSLSPSILAFYKDDAEDQIVPLPSLLKATGMDKKDRESLLEMIMEVSGTRKTVDAAMTTLQNINLFGVEGPFMEVTKKMEDAFHDLEKSFTRRQKADIKRRKFAFLNKNQLQTLYSKQGIQKEHHEEFDLDAYDRLSNKQREEALWKRVEIFAANGTDITTNHRSKRQIPGEIVIRNMLEVFDPSVLHPYMFKPIYGLSVLGPTVLSPSLFSPLILNPSVISPYVLSPAIGMPFILSPYLLSPYVLSPMVFDPFILSPYVLSPNVINPYVMSPVILSPIVLSPDVLSPMVLGGNILSPSFASPSIFTKNTLTVSVLSPSFLS